jgi:hypothetical protein
VVVAALTAALAVSGPAPAAAGQDGADYNGDGFDDLAIGEGRETINGVEFAGAVNVLYGTDGGLRAKGDQFWHQDSPGIRGRAKLSEVFGRALAAGDFDNDGFDDLAVGGSGDSLGGVKGGAVNVIYGSAAGLAVADLEEVSRASELK